MSDKCCLNCKWWDTFSIPNCCGLTIKQNNIDFKNIKYNIEDKTTQYCNEWKLSPFNIF